MGRTDNDTWDLATSVGATATGVAVGRALANRADNPLIDDPAAGLAEGGQTFLMGAIRIEQYRVGGYAAAPQEGCRPQRVAAVVARADHGAHPPPGNPAGAGDQLADDRGGQSVGSTGH